MASDRLYYDDAYTVQFDAQVASAGEVGGRPAVELDRTYFYPESGGQQPDRGTLAGVPVIDVQADDSNRVWHVLDLAAHARPNGSVGGAIDWVRRFDFMQQHTGQHILSAALEHELGAATLSSTLGEAHSTIEVELPSADWRLVERIERAANRVVWNDRPVERHWVDDEGLKRFKLRKAPKVTGRIRIVEIPEWDVSACGGTHTQRTGEVGVIKVLGWERLRGHVRFQFLCGERALNDHAWRTEALVEAARRRTLHDRDLLEHLERAASERDSLKKELKVLSEELLLREARERVGQPPSAVADLADARTRADVRTFAIKCLEAGAPWVVAASTGPEPALVAARAKGEGADLRTLVPALIERSRGKGGGSPDMVQVAAADAKGADEAFVWAVEAVRAACEGGKA